MRGKTHAYHKMEDDVAEDVKIRRLNELIAVFHEHASAANAQRFVLVASVVLLLLSCSCCGPLEVNTP